MKTFSILALDLHNTLYDEVMEYGLAMDAAITIWVNAAKASGKHINRQDLYAELSVAHQNLGSDWDDNVWYRLPLLQDLGLSTEQFQTTYQQAVTCRKEKSKMLTKKGAYQDIHQTLALLKAHNVHIYLITEAAADIAMQSIAWLGLEGIVDGVYSYPSRNLAVKIENTYHKSFPPHPENPNEHLRKPHPFLLARVILDDTKRRGKIPRDLQVEDLFAIRHDASMMLPEFDPKAPIQQDICAQLILKLGPYKSALQETIDSMLYGKKINKGEEALFKKSKALLYAVSGWDKDTLKLTQEAGNSVIISVLQPDFTFNSGLAEIMVLFNGFKF
jgi:hypothetical protein